MRVQLHWIKDVKTGRLGTMPRPRGGDWLEDEIASLQQQGVTVLVSLLEPEEVAELQLEHEAACCERFGLMFLSFPIADRAVPASNSKAIAFVMRLVELLRAGNSLVIHCRQGIGRASLIEAAVLMQFGLSADEAFARITIARGCAVPDTQAQRDWVATLL